MNRNKLPVVPEDKVSFYRRKLIREVSNLFKWEGLPEEIPVDYLEQTLIKSGRVMFFYDERAYGYMALEGNVRGFNLYNQPTQAYSVCANDIGIPTNYSRTIMHKYDNDIPKDDACVLINNMYNGESLQEIIDHYAYRLALVQQAFDTNALWQNIPVIFSTDNNETKISIDKLFEDIMTGKPWIVVDKTLLAKENGLQTEAVEVPFLLDKLYDSKNEIYNEFKMTIGLNTSGADKKERLLVDEVNSNKESTETCLEIMLSQRKIACEEINRVFGLNVTVGEGFTEEEEGEGEEVGDNGAKNDSRDE